MSLLLSMGEHGHPPWDMIVGHPKNMADPPNRRASSTELGAYWRHAVSCLGTKPVGKTTDQRASFPYREWGRTTNGGKRER